MNRDELLKLSVICAHVANGGKWECQWGNCLDHGGRWYWAAPGGRDLEYCIANRINVRTVGEAPAPNESWDDYISNPMLAKDAIEESIDDDGLRDWFAGMALQAIIAKIPPFPSVGVIEAHHRIAKGAYNYADAMLAARKGGA